MAEERIIDDEYGRGVKLRKTADGYVDVTDELAPPVEEEGEEISFAFPVTEEDEDDEDLVGLTPEEAENLRRQKAEAAERLRAEYERMVAEGNTLLETDSFHAAELKFEKALKLDGEPTEASVGYWKAKTANFANPDVLIEEYVEAGVESLEYDLGYEATDILKKEYREVFKKRYETLSEQEKPLRAKVEEKQQARREVLTERKKKRLIAFIATAIPFFALTILAVIFGLKNFSTPDNTYVPITVVFAVLAVVGFFAFAICGNKLLNACRIYATNERLTSTEEGEELARVVEYKELYLALLDGNADEE